MPLISIRNFPRINIRLKAKNITMFFMISKTYTVEGYTSRIDDNTHIFMIDFKEMPLEEVKKSLEETKQYFEQKYKRKMSNIYIVSDKLNSYRAWSFTYITFEQLIELISVTKGYDVNYLRYTVAERQATLRISKKPNRDMQKIVAVIKGEKDVIPRSMIKKYYDIGNTKKAISILIGDVRQ